jgi:hypothetical protein
MKRAMVAIITAILELLGYRAMARMKAAKQEAK